MKREKSIYRDEYQIIIDWLSSKREILGITQEGLAKKLDRPQSFISKYENYERRLDVVEFLEICKILGVNPKEIFDKVI